MKVYQVKINQLSGTNFKEIRKKAFGLYQSIKGITPKKELFFVQIKEQKNSNKKWLMSAFPIDK